MLQRSSSTRPELLTMLMQSRTVLCRNRESALRHALRVERLHSLADSQSIAWVDAHCLSNVRQQMPSSPMYDAKEQDLRPHYYTH